MTDLKLVATDDLRPLVTLLRDIPKPIPFSDYPAVFEQLNWTRNRKSGGLSNYNVNLPLASVGQQRGEVSRLRTRVSDTLEESGPASREAVQAPFRS